jgi:UTP--glucose-1-phosphate uridylyltransferase
MVEAHAKVGGNMVAVMDVARDHTSRYGIVDPSSDDGHLVGVKGLVEKPRPANAPSTLAVIGRYILQPEVFFNLDRQERGAGGEIQLTDALADLLGIMPFHGLRFEGRRFDCGDKVGFLEANIAFALERPDMGGQVRDILKSYGG